MCVHHNVCMGNLEIKNAITYVFDICTLGIATLALAWRRFRHDSAVSFGPKSRVPNIVRIVRFDDELCDTYKLFSLTTKSKTITHLNTIETGTTVARWCLWYRRGRRGVGIVHALQEQFGGARIDQFLMLVT